MTVTISGTSGITTPGVSSSGDVTLAGSGVELLNNSGRIVVGQSGSVIQVVSSTYSTLTSTASASYVATGAAVSITPSSTSSKVAIFVGNSNFDSTAAGNGYLTLYRGASQLTDTEFYMNRASGGNQHGWSMMYVDSPASTSSTTYALYWKASSSTIYLNYLAGRINMIAMEIAQ